MEDISDPSRGSRYNWGLLRESDCIAFHRVNPSEALVKIDIDISLDGKIEIEDKTVKLVGCLGSWCKSKSSTWHGKVGCRVSPVLAAVSNNNRHKVKILSLESIRSSRMGFLAGSKGTLIQVMVTLTAVVGEVTVQRHCTTL